MLNKCLFITLMLLTFDSVAYNGTLVNDSNSKLEIIDEEGVKIDVIKPNKSKVIDFQDNDEYLIRAVHSVNIIQNIGTIFRIGFNKKIQITMLQQPNNRHLISWIKDYSIGSTSYFDSKLKSYPKVIQIKGCTNLGWGARCSNISDEFSMTLSGLY